jgi:tubulin-folding cofactor B
MMSNLVTHEYTVVTEGLVNVLISSNCNEFTSEKKFNKDLTIALLKNKLELITGASALSMKIAVYDKKDTKVCELSDPDALLGSYQVDSGMRLHVDDPSSKGEFEDPNVKKVIQLHLYNNQMFSYKFVIAV